jgi:uncharacterized MAPEG superfamily protein
MSIAKWAVLAACLLPILTVGSAKVALGRQSRKNGGYDNEHPRDWESKLTGWHARAHAAQLNGFEALPLFIAGVLFAQMGGGDPNTIDILAVSFVLVRIVYIVTYLKNLATLRSLVWTVGVGICVALLMMGS